MVVNLDGYGLSAGAQLGQSMSQQNGLLPNNYHYEERAYRAQALSMAIEHHKNCGHGDVAEMVAKFLVFLKGEVNV
jgi:hypothetical protein